MTPRTASVIQPGPTFRQSSTDRGISTEAHIVLLLIQDVERRAWYTEQSRVRHQRESALDETFLDCSEADWDGYGAAPANELSKEWARRVLATLPIRLGVPEIAFEPDGDAELEWWRGPDRVLTVSVGRNGELRYAARLNAARVIGTEMFADGLPQRLVETALELVD